jgi:hypothetical protein
VDQALVTYLRNTTAISALAGTNIDWGLRPQGSALPALGLTVISRVPVDSDEGDSGLWQSRVQIDCWAASMTGAKALAMAVKALLSGKRHESTPSFLEGVWSENETDYSAEIDKGGTPIMRVSVDFLFNHIE